MFKKILIANRGEIACRIARTCRRLGVAVAGVHSSADRDALHVRQIGESVEIGGAPASESYLRIDAVIAAAKSVGAEAIHPGFGFLAENAAFARAVEAAGLVFIGPTAEVIERLGDKAAAKREAKAAKVPIVPGSEAPSVDPAEIAASVRKVGLPVMLKAAAGGGGKGMRGITSFEGLELEIESAMREAKNSFGDAGLIVEKLIRHGRHIEIQIAGDGQGRVIHLFERECTLQRRHQKVIEEAPAPGMDAATRQALCAAAVKAARAVDYVGAGTIEFIADGSQGLRADAIWFMEMNTRLQVEHPVTESITGQDLVEWQLRVASGEALPLAQDQLSIHGWAMEARLYAENPSNRFLPSIGPLERLRLPEDIRVDSGVEEGGEVSPFYDPMIAKLIAHAPTRAQAARRLAQACAQVQVWPVRTNAAFLARTAAHPQFVAGQVDTGFIARHLDALLPPAVPPPALLDQAASALLPAPDGSPWTALRGFRANAPLEHRAAVRVGEAIHLAQWHAGPAPALVAVEGTQLLFDAGQAWPVAVPALGEAGAAGETGDGALLAPMPGRIVAVQVAQGEQVARGQALVVLEAMKMEQTLQAPFAGTVRELSVQVGAQVSEGKVLLVIEQEQAA